MAVQTKYMLFTDFFGTNEINTALSPENSPRSHTIFQRFVHDYIRLLQQHRPIIAFDKRLTAYGYNQTKVVILMLLHSLFENRKIDNIGHLLERFATLEAQLSFLRIWSNFKKDDAERYLGIINRLLEHFPEPLNDSTVLAAGKIVKYNCCDGAINFLFKFNTEGFSLLTNNICISSISWNEILFKTLLKLHEQEGERLTAYTYSQLLRSFSCMPAHTTEEIVALCYPHLDNEIHKANIATITAIKEQYSKNARSVMSSLITTLTTHLVEEEEKTAVVKLLHKKERFLNLLENYFKGINVNGLTFQWKIKLLDILTRKSVRKETAIFPKTERSQLLPRIQQILQLCPCSRKYASGLVAVCHDTERFNFLIHYLQEKQHVKKSDILAGILLSFAPPEKKQNATKPIKDFIAGDNSATILKTIVIDLSTVPQEFALKLCQSIYKIQYPKTRLHTS